MIGEEKPLSSGETVAVKSHTLKPKLVGIPERCIILFRNPADAFISTLNLWVTKSHTHKINFSQVFDESSLNTRTRLTKTKLRKQLIHDLPFQYIQTYDFRRTTACRDNLTVYYENLKTDALQEIARILEFLGFSKERMKCLDGNLNGHFKRNNQRSSNRQWISNFLSKKDKSKLTAQMDIYVNKSPLGLPKNYTFY